MISRRGLLHLMGAAATIAAVPRICGAQTYPSRPVRWIVGFAAGGVVDIYARLLGQWLSDRLGQPFIIENHLGAGSNLAMEAIVRAPPDGYTIGSVTVTNAINATLFEKLNFNIVRDIAPVANFTHGPALLVVRRSFPAQTVAELIAYAKANPGRINMASPGIGSTHHIYGELFKGMTEVNMVHVPYRAYPQALSDLLAEQMDLMFDNIPPSIEHIKSGRIRALGVTSATRWDALPDIPCVSDFVPGYEAIGWQGLCAPANTPREIVERLNTEINAALANPTIKARILDMGGSARPMAAQDFSRSLAAETEKWAKVIRAASIRAE